MSLESFYRKIDEHEENGLLDGFPLRNSGKELANIHKDLSGKSILDIPSQYRKDIQNLLESSLFFPGAKNSDQDESLTKLLDQLRDA